MQRKHPPQVALGAANLESLDVILSGMPRIVDVAHSPSFENAIVASRKDTSLKASLIALANQGYVLYKSVPGLSSFCQIDAIPRIWSRVKAGEYLFDDQGVIYSYTPPVRDVPNPRMIVIFSSIYDPIYSSSLLRHFQQNFSKIQKYIPEDASILRIADFGGVVGAFYMNTNYRPDNADRVAKLIFKVAQQYGVAHDDILLFGTSKGGTAAAYHGLRSNWRAVSVDPIVSDEHYINRFSDSHFVTGIFPETKEQAFRKVVSERKWHPGRLTVIYSHRSPQFRYIEKGLVDPLEHEATFLDSGHPDINDHPDVAPKNKHYMLMAVNAGFAKISLPRGRLNVPF